MSSTLLNTFDQRLVHRSSIALAENLRHVKTTDDMALEEWLQEVRLEIRSHNTTATEDELIARVREMALEVQQQHSTLPGLNNTNKSSQLNFFLQQLNNPVIMTWDRIQQQAAGDSDKQLELLLQLEHLSDIMPDWHQVRPFLRQGLCSNNSQPYLLVHDAWFRKSRSSTEFRNLQMDLCENVLESMDTATTNNTSLHVSLLLSMFTDWMLRGLYVQDTRVYKIGCQLWKHCCGTDAVAMAIKECDPDALWFSAWCAHLSPDQCLQVVVAASGSTSGTVIDLTQHFWLAIVRSILVTTRVCRFPWDLLNQITPVALLEVYLTALMTKVKHGIYVDAVETLLAGARTALTADEFDTMRVKLKDFATNHPDLWAGNVV